MGAQADLYRYRKIITLSEAEHEQHFYTSRPSEIDWRDQPCGCQWNSIKRELLGLPYDDGIVIACACAGPYCFVPGYPHDKAKMRAFAEKQEERWLCNLILARLSGSGLVVEWVRR